MSITKITPYLFFNGDADAAIAHYTAALGAKSEVMRYSDMPAHVGTPAPADRDRVMHATLHIGSATLMISDRQRADQATATDSARSNVHVNLAFDDPEELAAKFEALGAGGKVVMAVHDAFWGGKFGVLVDKFGFTWMFTSAANAG